MYKNANVTLEMLDSGIDSLARIQIDTFFYHHWTGIRYYFLRQ